MKTFFTGSNMQAIQSDKLVIKNLLVEYRTQIVKWYVMWLKKLAFTMQ